MKFDSQSEAFSRMSALKVGDWVEIRSAAEIAATLDLQGDRDRMPFMPEMIKHAGRRYQVTASAHKTCDTVNRTGARRLAESVHLADLRCDGTDHGGCQAECLLFWKACWLRKVDGPGDAAVPKDVRPGVEDLERMLSGNVARREAVAAPRYRCQATQLFAATAPLAWWDLRQYWRDVRSGNIAVGRVASTLLLASVFSLRRLPVGYRLSCRVYAILHKWVRGEPDPHVAGSIPRGKPTPDVRKDLQVGEIVEILPRDAIERTLNTDNRNRGLHIDEEMTTYCGGRYAVSTRVERIVNERTGEMMHFQSPCIVLAGVVCKGAYSEDRLLCPRRITTYWREIWLKRVEVGSGAALAESGGASQQ